jgi:DNA-binding transcriptional regulator YdaS (Cro superfamily)
MNDTLLIWQKQNDISNRDLAGKIPCHESLICHYHAGRKSLSPQKCQRIEQISGGAVTLRELLFPEQTKAGVDNR